jgi:hypothetical protein
VIGIPNIDSFNANSFKKHLWCLGASIHTLNYSTKTLSSMLEKHDFLIEKLIKI